MAMSDAYWNATKPNGMPDYVWQAQQAARKAEEEAKKAAEEAAKKKAAEEAAAKKAAEEAAKKAAAQKAAEQLLAAGSGSGIIPSTQDKINSFGAASVGSNIAVQKAAEEAAKKATEESAKKANGTSTNDARAEQMAIKNNTTPDYNKDYTGNANNTTGSAYDTLKGIVASDPLWVDDNTAMLEAKKAAARAEGKDVGATPIASSSSSSKPSNTGLTTEDARDEKIAIQNGTVPSYAVTNNGYVPVADLNRPTNGSGVVPKSDNSGLTTEDARKEHIGIMNNPTINPPTDGQISAGVIIPSQSPTIPSQSTTIPQETIDQITQLLKDNAPKDVIYTPTDYVGGTYTPQYPQGSGTESPTLSTTSDAVAQYALAIMQAAKGNLGEVVRPEYVQAVAPTSPELRSLEELANTYGITYDYDSIYKVLNDSVEKQYDAIYERQKQNEAAYYDNATAAQNTLLDTLSRDRSNAVSAGVSKGMQAANALGAMLGVSQQFAGNATALSQERGNTAKEYGASLAKAVVDAERTSNERKNAIMEIAKMLYGYDSEQYVANMDNYNTILTNNAALQQNYMSNQTTLQNALASIFNSSASSKITGDANIQANQAVAEANRYAAYQAAEAQRYAAHQAAEANKQAAASAAQGNVDAYRLYANALVQQALASRGVGYEVPQNNGYVPVADLNSATNGNNKKPDKNTVAMYEAMNNALMSGFYY